MAEAAAPSRAAPDAGSPVSEEEVFDALLAVSLTDDTPAALVSASAQGALARLGQASNQTLVQRAVDMLSQHAKELAEQRERPNTLARRTALFRLLASIVRNQAPSAGARAGGVDVTDYVIEQVVNDLEWEQGVGDEEEDVESLRGAAEALLVQLAAHHMDAVLSRLLLRLDNACCLFQQQQGPAPGARSRLRPAMQWFAEKGAPADRRVAGLLAGIEALARGVPDVLAQHLKKVLAAMLPVISLSTSSSTKEAWSGAMCAYCEAVQAQNEEHRAAGRGALALAVDDSARMAMLAAFDVLALSWAASPDTVVQRCSFLSLAAMMCLLPPDDVRARLPQVISTLCQLLAVANTTMQVRVCLLDPALQRQLQALVRSLAAVLLISLEDAALPCSAARDCSHVVLPMGLTIMRAVLPAASRPAALSDKVQVGIFNDALQCFRLLAEVDAQPVVALLLSALTLDGQAVARPKGAAEMRQQQWGALALFAHLASRVPAALEASSSVVLTHAMIHCANSPDALVRVQLADLVMALAPLGYLHDDAASDVRGDCVRFLVASASACRADLRVAARMSAGGGVGWFGGRGGGSRDGAATWDAAFSAAQWWWPGGVSSRDGDGVARLQEALEQMRLVCGNGLYVLATKLPRPERLLWPGLLGFLVDARYSVALPVLCRAMAGLAVECESGVLAASLRAQDHSADASAERATERATDDATDNRGGVPRPSDILARILVAHAALADAGGVGAGAGAGARAHLVRGLMALSFLYPAPVADGIEQELPGLLESDAGESERCGGGAVRVANALRKCLQGAEEEFVVAVGEAIMAQRALYADDDAAASASASILLGSVLVAVRHDTRFVRVGLHQLLADTDHSTLLESEACALAFGTCAARHLSVTVEVLDDILKTRTVCDAAASIRERLAGWLGRVRLSTAASARDDDLARELGVASALLALAHVLISEGEKGVLIHTAMEVVPAEGAVLRHLGDILALAQPHLQPHKNIMGVGGVGAGLGVGDDIIDNARVVFVEFSVQALVRHEGMVAHDVLLRHVECVLSCVPWLIERCISSQSALQTLGEVTGVLRGGGHGGGQALERAKRLVRVCACVCKLQGVLMRPVDEAAKRVMDLGVCMRYFEQVLRVVDAAMALMAADGTPLPTQPQNERPDTAALATTLGDCCAGAVHNLCGSGGGAGMEASLALAVRVLQRLRSFSTGSCALGRARACSVLVRVLRAVPACGARQSQTREAGWGGEEVGTLAAFFVPRLADASASVREAAVEGLHVLMHLLGWKLETTAVGVDGGGAADGHGKPVIDEEEGDEERAVRVVGAQAGCVQSLFLFDLESVAVGVEELVRATGREVQAPCAHAAVAALTLILGMEDGQVGQKLHETNESECVGVSNMSSEGAAAMARDVIILGAGASVGSVQWRAAAMCVRVLMISHFEALAQYLLALELADGARAFALASLHGPAGLRGIPGGQERDYHVCVAKFVRYLGEVLSDSTRQDAAAVAAQAWRRHAAVDIQEGYVSFCDLAASVDAERKVVVGDGSVAEQVREGVRRQVVRLVKDLLVDPSWRRAVDPISMTVSLSVHLGALLLQRGGDGDGWGDSLWARPGSNAALEASACLAIVLRTARAQEAVSFLQRHEPAWATASESAGVAALHELSYEVFASTFARTPADYTKIANLLASVLGGPGAAGVARGSGGLPGLVPISDDFGDDEEEGQAGGGDATVRSSSLVCLAALSHAAAQHPPRNARTHGSGVEGFECKPMASACDKAEAAGACDGDTLLHLTDLLLPHILPPPPPEGSSKTPRSRGTPRPCSPWPVSVVAAVVAAVPALAQSAQVLRQRGDKLLSALMRCCEGAEAHQWVAAPADPPAVADAPAMSLEHAAMLAEMTKRRQHDCERLVQEAAAAVAVLVRVLPSEQARGAAFSASEVSRAWFPRAHIYLSVRPSIYSETHACTQERQLSPSLPLSHARGRTHTLTHHRCHGPGSGRLRRRCGWPRQRWHWVLAR